MPPTARPAPAASAAGAAGPPDSAARLPAPPRRRRRGGFLTPPWWFAAPALLVYALIVLYPSASGILYAFTDWNGIGDRSFVGADNFDRLLRDDAARGSLVNTLLLTVAIVVVQNGIGLLLALGVHTRIRSRAVLRVVFFAPAVVSPVMVAFLWKYVYNPAPDAGSTGSSARWGSAPCARTGSATPRWRCGRWPAW